MFSCVQLISYLFANITLEAAETCSCILLILQMLLAQDGLRDWRSLLKISVPLSYIKTYRLTQLSPRFLSVDSTGTFYGVFCCVLDPIFFSFGSDLSGSGCISGSGSKSNFLIQVKSKTKIKIMYNC